MAVEVQWRRAYVRVRCRSCGGTVRKWGELGFVRIGAAADRLGPWCRRCVFKVGPVQGLRLAPEAGL